MKQPFAFADRKPQAWAKHDPPGIKHGALGAKSCALCLLHKSVSLWDLEGTMSWGNLGKEEVTRDTGPEAGIDSRTGGGKEEVQGEI